MSLDHEQLGPYRVSHVLGSGGMGVVYAARDTRDGTLAAVKVARVHPASRRALEIEIEALSQLSHPGVVRFLGHGTHEGSVWVATELVIGRPLRDHVDSSHPSSSGGAVSTVLMEDLTGGGGDVPDGAGERLVWGRESLLGTLAVFRRLCTPLAWLHGEGLVHGDVKPENVLVRHDGSVVLVDFGLFRSSGTDGRDALSTTRKLSGTAAYLSPEQGRGLAPDARSDLYAVGCMLYEWLTGHPPFGRTPYAVRMHVDAPVPPISDFAVVPDAVESLVMSLLEKQPRRRLGFATDLAEALEALGVAPDPHPGPPPRRVLYRPAFVGRERELGDLELGRAVGVVGAEGLGRTRLLSALVERSDEPRVLAVDARSPGGPLRGLLRALAARSPDAETAARWFADAPEVLVAIEPELARVEGVGPQPEPEPTPPAAASAREAAAVARALGAAAPLRVVVDDLHLADERDQAAIIELVRRNVPGVRVAVSAGSGHRLAERLSAAGAEIVTLGPLDAPAMEELVAEMLALPSLPDELMAFVHDRAGGNPRFASEVLRLLVDEGLLVRRHGRWVVAGRDALGAVPWPGGITQVAVRRWRTLSGDGRAAVEQAAIAGVGTLSDRAVAELVRAGVFEVRDGAVRWVVPALRELAVGQLAPERRAALHALALDALPDDAPPAVRAEHLDGAGRPDEALAAWREALQLARTRARWGEVLQVAERVISLPGTTAEERLSARTDRVAALRMRGRWADAVVAAEEALADLDGASDGAIVRCRLEHGRALARAGRLDDALEVLAAAAAGVVGAPGEPIALEALAECLSEAGRLPESVDARRRVVALRLAEGDEQRVAEARVALANVLQRQDLAVEAAALLDLALPVIRAGGRALWLANALATRSLVAGGRGDEATAEATAREAATVFRRLGMLASETQVTGALVESLRRQGRRQECEDALAVMESLAAEVGAPRLRSAVAYNRAMVQVTLGGPDPQGALREAIALSNACGHGQVEGTSLLHLAELLRRDGRFDEAVPLLDRVEALAEQRGDLGFACCAATERGHHALHAGEPAGPWIARAEALLARMPDATDYVVHLQRLRDRAVGGGGDLGTRPGE